VAYADTLMRTRAIFFGGILPTPQLAQTAPRVHDNYIIKNNNLDLVFRVLSFKIGNWHQTTGLT